MSDHSRLFVGLKNRVLGCMVGDSLGYFEEFWN